MQHHAHAQSRAQIRRARRQKTKALRKRKIQMFLQRIIQPIRLRPRLLQLQPRPQHLQPQMVLLIHHHADGFIVRNRHPARPFPRRMLLGDQMPLDQHLPIDLIRLFHIHIKRRPTLWQPQQPLPTKLVQLRPLQADSPCS